jgi:hypothetical protein
LKVDGEGMPLKKSDLKGDLFFVVKIDFPENGWTEDAAAFESLKKILPGPVAPITATDIDEVEYDSEAEIEDVSYLTLFGCFPSDQISSVPILEILVQEVDGRMKMPMRAKAQHSVLSNDRLSIEEAERMAG